MELSKNIKIKYEITNTENGEKTWITLTVEQIEGSVPNFYKQIQKSCKLDQKVTEITKREIVEEKNWIIKK